MSGVVVVGAQWGDEGKGKLVDVFAAKADFVVRFQGGSNAGHTLVVNGQKSVLHLIPSGILHPQTTCVIASGVVVDLEGVLIEIKKLQASGVLNDPKRLWISDQCTIILPYHKKLDQLREKSLNDQKIGTTGKGIGPAYEDRAARRALVLADLFDKTTLKEKIAHSLKEKNFLIENLYKDTPISVDETYEQALKWAEELKPFRAGDVSYHLFKALKAGKRVLFEGAQGTLLDLQHGTYPYVTSSSTLAAAACTSSGLGPMQINQVIGVFKAYATRVGSGPFPTELKDETGLKIQEIGHEFGSTTGRARRCGWIDLVALKYAIRVNGITNLALMKLDVLSNFEKVGFCTAYKINGELVQEFPSSAAEMAKVEPVVEYIAGWTEDITQVTQLKDLPRHATNYIDFIGNYLGCPIDIISVGPGREQTLWVKPLFKT